MVIFVGYYLRKVVDNFGNVFKFVLMANNKKQAELFSSIKIYSMKKSGLYNSFSNIDVLLSPTKRVTEKAFDKYCNDDSIYLGNYTFDKNGCDSS